MIRLMVRRLVKHLSPRRVPLMARASYRREQFTAMTMPVAVSLVEGGTVGLLGKMVFSISDAQLATITAAPMFANLTSAMWARLARGRRKTPVIFFIMSTALLLIASISLLPINPLGNGMLTAIVVATRCLLAGIVTLRSTVWRHNYPRALRGRITGRLTLVIGITMLVAPFIFGLLIDHDPQSFRYTYPLAACIGLVGAINYSRLRVRGERKLLYYERLPHARPIAHGDAAPVYEYDEQETQPRMSMWAILKHDPLFRRYMIWQFFAGISNMMVEPVIVLILAHRTQGLNYDFLLSIAIVHGLPVLLMLATLEMWGGLIDRLHITTFRARQSWLWTVALILTGIAAAWTSSLAGSLILLAVARIILGIARGGGVLAWQLGHNDFAARHLVAHYMGLHVTLTGVRGAFAPYLGLWLYASMGAGVFVVAVACSIASVIGFYSLHRDIVLNAPPDTTLVD